MMNSYHVSYAIDTATVVKYKKFCIVFNDANDSNGEHLPVPAIYVVNKNGVIDFVHFDPDYTRRFSVKEVLHTYNFVTN